MPMNSAIMRLAKSGYVPKPLALAHREPRPERNVVEDNSPLVGEIAHGNIAVGPEEAAVLSKVLDKVWKESSG